MNAAWVTAATALAAAVGGLLLWSGRWAWRILSGLRDFLGDWGGQPPRPGVEARPGVMSRLQAVESKLARVLAETQPNHGHSLRDVVHRTADDVADVKDQMTRLTGRVEQIEHARQTREGKDHG